MQASQASNTVRTYARRWQHFTEWCARAGYVACPATPEAVKLYVAWALDVDGSRLETVKISLSAIADRHRTEGQPSPVTTETRQFVTSCARHLQEEPRGRAALAVRQLKRICASLGDRPIDIRNRALLLLGFATGWRRSELSALNLSDLTFMDEGVAIRLRRSKTDQEGRGRSVGIHYGSSPDTCPVRALEDWIKVRGKQAGALFLRGERNGGLTDERMSPHTVCAVVKDKLEKIGVDPARYGAHSLRTGFVTAAAAQGSSPMSIMDRTGHKSLNTVLRYVRPTQAFRSDPLAGVL